MSSPLETVAMLRNETLTLEKLAQTVERQAEALAKMNERIEDLEDLRVLQEAITANAGRPLKSWTAARGALGLTDEELTRAASEYRQE